MHSSGSANGSRPRQRTFTSCTECRRRKQRCNQAKDRPCNNCSRRYPPVLCTYESSSPPPSHDRVVDLPNQQHLHQGHPSHAQNPIGTHQNAHSQVPNPAYSQPVHSPSFIPTTTATDYYSIPYGHSYYNSATTRPYYNDGSASDTSSAGSTAQIHAATTSAGDFLMEDGATYYAANASDQAVFTGGYYDAQGVWVTGSSDGGPYVNGSGGDFFYGGEDAARTTRG